ncbi:unnamed protein product [Alternaria sp. RS040]
MSSNGSFSSGIDISLPTNRPSENGKWTPELDQELRAREASNVQTKPQNAIAPEFFRHGKRSLSGIAVRAFCLGCALAFGLFGTVLLAYNGSHLWRPFLFLSTLSLFHFLEFYTTAAYNTPIAYIDSFLLTNGDQYRQAHAVAFVETLVTSYLFPGYQSTIHPSWLIALGIAMIAVGQAVRSTAMMQAGTNFNHQVQSRKNDGHELVTHGVYRYFRHPSYFGFFWWGIGTQIMLGNTVCFFGFTGVLWYFFMKRITHEEKFLIKFFGNENGNRIETPWTVYLPGLNDPTSPQLLPTCMPQSNAWHMSPPSAEPSAWASGDARSNLAVQPAANLGSIKLKKNAVKMVGAAGPIPSTASRPAALTLPMASSPNAGPAKVELKVSDGQGYARPTVAPKSSSVEKSTVTSSATTTKSDAAAPQKEDTNATSDAFEEFAMDALYARLNSKTVLTPRNPIGSTSVRPEQAKFAFGDRLAEPKADNTKIDGIKFAVESQEELENAYMRKASDYIQAIPDVNGNTASLIKAMSRKLRGSYMPEVKTDVEKNEIIKARLAFAIANYINKVLKKRPEQPRTPESIKQTLKDANGDFLRLCAKLVEEGHLSLETLAEVSGVVAAMHNILPKPEPPVTMSVIALTKAAPPVASNTENTKPVSKDPADDMKGWPIQEKRENPAAHRTCILKGVAGITSINQLQALVWGGKLESISLPEPGSSNALVKFLTPEACEKYHKATTNGIEIVGDIKKAVVFVEKAEGPNSINDVIRNCIDGDASRCVRAIGADEDSDAVLMKLARGRGVNKRDVDRIKSGKTARGHSYVEFRFSNIYHALNFKRELMDNDDWEHCSIGYAPDPCELANGVHYKDKDEE